MLRLLFSIIAFVISVNISHGAMTGSWVNHPAMQTVTYTNPYHTVKIIPGAARTYFLVHANMYYSNGPDYNNTPYLTLFYHDNEADVTTQNMMPADKLTGNLSANLIDCAYSPEHKFLFGILDTGETFILHDDGAFLRGENLSRVTVPGKLNVNGIAFDSNNGDVWVATRRGIMAFDKNTLSKIAEISSDHDVNAVGVVGNRLIVSLTESANSMPTLRSATLDHIPLNVVDFSPMAITNDVVLSNVTTTDKGVVCVSDITPLTNNTFAFLAPALSGQGLSLNIISLLNNECRLLNLHSQPLTIIPNLQKANTNYEGFVSTCADGYNFKLQNLLHLAKGTDPDPALNDAEAVDQFKKDCLWRQINVETQYLGADLRNAKAGSWNNRDFWFYVTAQGFVRRTVADNVTSATSATDSWLYASQPVMMNSPTVHHASFFSWHPEFGMLCRQHGYDNFFLITGAQQLDQLCGYKNGVWTPYGLAVKNYNSRLVHYNNFGIAIDPDNPEFVYSGSYMTGLLRLNLNDPDDLLHITTGNDYKPSTRSYDVKICDYLDMFTPSNKAWSYFSEPKFDAYGNLWSAYFWGLACNFNETVFCCWEKNDRLASATANSEKGFKQWKSLHAKTGADRSNRHLLLPLKTEQNRNILAFNSGGYGAPVLIYDHAGTIENLADDRYVLIENPVDSLGRKIDYDYAHALFEDPSSGNLWVLTQTGVYWVNPASAFGNPNRLNRLELADASDYNGKTVLLETFGANAMCADDKGRKWIGTHHGGIICISKDASTLLAHITTENSQLADNSITAIAWNPDNNSLMISTLKGIQEFFPDEGNSESAKKLTVTPAIVSPGFTGYLTITSLDNSKEYVVLNRDTQSRIGIGKPVDGTIQWDLRKNSGIKAEAGNYAILTTDENKEIGHFILAE